jgi:ssDNA-binding Zn-finger/Zn-ribbon topoisomerase 1
MINTGRKGTGCQRKIKIIGGNVPKKKCPECGAKLVKRRSKYGEFWGCSKFTECRGKESIRKKDEYDYGAWDDEDETASVLFMDIGQK